MSSNLLIFPENQLTTVYMHFSTCAFVHFTFTKVSSQDFYPPCRGDVFPLPPSPPLRSRARGEDKGGLGKLSPPTIEISPTPKKHDGRSSATYEFPQKIFAC